jgi:hypothetical protein
LELLSFNKPFFMEIDALDVGIGAVLQQDGRHITYLSKASGPLSFGLSTYEKECMAVLYDVKHWRSYLMLGEFVIKTDQCNLGCVW